MADIRVCKVTNYDRKFVEIRLPSGSLVMLTPDEAKELYAKMEWVV